MTDKLITNSSDTDKALIEKARDCVCEKCMDKDSCFRENNCPDIQTFIAGANFMADKVEKLEARNEFLELAFIRLRQVEAENEKLLMQLQEKHIADRCLLISGEVWANILNNRHKLFFEVKHLQQQLDEAVEIIKTISKNANHYDKIDLQNKAEQFLSSLDKPIKEEL